MGCLIKMVKQKGPIRNLSFNEKEKNKKNKKHFKNSKRKPPPKEYFIFYNISFFIIYLNVF